MNAAMAPKKATQSSGAKTLLRRLLQESRPFFRWYVLVAAGLFIGSLCGLAVTDSLRRLVDGAASGDLSMLRTAFYIGILGFGGTALVNGGTGYLQAWVNERSSLLRQQQLTAKVYCVHMEYVTNQHSGDLITRLTNNAYEAQTGLNSAFIEVFRNTAQILVTLIYLVSLNAPLAVGTLVTAAVGPAVINFVGSRLRVVWRLRLKLEGELSALVQDMVQGAETVRTFMLQNWLTRRFDKAYIPFLGTVRKTEVWNQAMQFTGFSMFVAGVFFVLGYGGALTAKGELTVGMIAAFLVSFERINHPLARLLSVWPNLQNALAAAERIYDLVDAPLAPGSQLPQPSTNICKPLTLFPLQAVRLEHVSFAYPGRENNVLDDITLTIPIGGFTAIVGETGSGKTSVLRLLLRLYDPASGGIRLVGADGASSDLREFSLVEWRRLIGYIPQDVMLYDGTLAQNIAVGADIAAFADLSGQAQAKIAEAARQAYLDEVVARLTAGYDTPIGERGVKLSGGERQRVALARAVWRDPAILLLDEATSALDNQSERQVQQALFSVRQGRTCIAVAHRLTTVMHAQQIILFEAGRIVEQGTHNTLLESHGRYWQLCQAGQLLENGGEHSGKAVG